MIVVDRNLPARAAERIGAGDGDLAGLRFTAEGGNAAAAAKATIAAARAQAENGSPFSIGLDP